MSLDSEFGDLIARGLSDQSIPTERVVELLLAYSRNTSERLCTTQASLDQLKRAVDTLTSVVESHRSELQRNTEITASIQDAVNAWKIFHRIVKWTAAVAAALAGVWAAWGSIIGVNSK